MLYNIGQNLGKLLQTLMTYLTISKIVIYSIVVIGIIKECIHSFE